MADDLLPVERNSHRVATAPTFEQVKEMSKYFANSGLFGVKTPEQAFSLLMIAESEGMHPARAMQEYHVINNKPSLKAEAMLGRFQVAGGKVKWVEHEDNRVTAEFTHHASGTTSVTWDMDRAKQAGVLGNATWKKYPRQMLRARVISEGVRLSYPACIVGFYAPEELIDLDNAAPETPKQTETLQAEPELIPDATFEDAEQPEAEPEEDPVDDRTEGHKIHDWVSDNLSRCASLEKLDAFHEKHAERINALAKSEKHWFMKIVELFTAARNRLNEAEPEFEDAH